MTDPKRWLDDGAPPAVERMLRAGASEQPSDAALERALTAAGVSAVMLTATTTSAAGTGAATATAAAASGVFSKWSVVALVVTSVAGLATGVTIAWHAPPRPAPAFVPRPPATSGAAPSIRPHAVAPANGPAAPATGAAPERPRSARSAGSGDPATETAAAPDSVLPEETKCVDRARAAIASGNATAALAALDDYESRFPVRHYAPEALYLRMTALVAQGNTDAARRVAAHLLEAYPKSAQASRAQALLARSNP